MILLSYPPVVFSYYHRLSASQKRVYRKSDEIITLRLPSADALQPLVAQLPAALQAEKQTDIQRLCQALADGLSARLQVPALRIEVLAVRPANDWSELHGLYTPADGNALALIQLWMRTVRYRRVVAFRTFLRTLLHELCHHIDYELLALPDSFHTQGFYRRVASLYHQLLPAAQAEGTPVFADRPGSARSLRG